MGLNFWKIRYLIIIIVLISCANDKKLKSEFANYLYGEWKGAGEHIYFSKGYIKYTMYKNNLWSISKWRIIKVVHKRNLIYINFYDIKLTDYAVDLHKKYGLSIENILKSTTFIYIFDINRQKIKVYKGGNTPENILKKISGKQKP